MVILADEMILDKDNFLQSMINFQSTKESNSSIIAVAAVEQKEVYKYGIINPKPEENKIISMVEKPKIGESHSNLAISGRYILQPKIFEYLKNCEKGSGGEIQLTDAMQKMAQDYPFYYQEYQGLRFDCGNVLGFLEANIVFALENPILKNDILNILKKYT